MVNKRLNKIVAIFGRKGSGKTTLVKYISRHSRRMILIDPMAEYENGKIVYSREDLYEAATSEKYFRIIYRPIDIEDLQEYTSIDYAADLVLALKNVTFIIDEVDNFCNSYYMSNQLRYCIQYGRHYGVYIIVTSRQANRIRNDITSQADYIITFQQQGKHCLQYLNGFNDNYDENIIINLGNYYYVFIKGEKSLDIFSDFP